MVGLQIAQDFLGKTVYDCSVFECLGMGYVVINVTIWRVVVVLQVLNRVQAVEDVSYHVTTKIIEERVVVRLLVKNHAIVFQPIGSGPVHAIKHASCKRENQSKRERTYKQIIEKIQNCLLARLMTLAQAWDLRFVIFFPRHFSLFQIGTAPSFHLEDGTHTQLEEGSSYRSRTQDSLIQTMVAGTGLGQLDVCQRGHLRLQELQISCT
jgi:hypothetical protein